MFNPPLTLACRASRPPSATAETAPPLRGVVHDTTARFMGGVAGHAGLFSTADDLARFAEMMLHKGELVGVRLFSPLTVEKFTTPQSPARSADPARAGLGYRLSAFRAIAATCFRSGPMATPASPAHRVWIDPITNTYVILLTNSVHPVSPAGDHRAARQGGDDCGGGAGYHRAGRAPHRI